MKPHASPDLTHRSLRFKCHRKHPHSQFPGKIQFLRKREKVAEIAHDYHKEENVEDLLGKIASFEVFVGKSIRIIVLLIYSSIEAK
jgi:hypothetical protein